MKQYICPSCGHTYNGKRCRECYYEHFTEEIGHRNHTHRGEPLVIDGPRRKPIPRKDPFGCEKNTRKKRPFLGFLVLLLVINALLPLALNFGLELERREAALLEPEPDYFPIPDSAVTVYQDEELEVLVQWPQSQLFFRDFPVYLRNDSQRDVTVTARDLQINGYRMEASSLWCEASAGTPGMGMFFLSEQDQVNAGILAIEDLSFQLEIYDSESYETVAITPEISFQAELPEGTVAMRQLEGIPLLNREGLTVSYLGFSYAVSAYDPYAFEDGALLFHLENQSGKDLEISLTEGCVNGIAADLTAWCSLPAGAKAVVSSYVYPLEELDITQPQQLQELAFTLEVWESGSYDQVISPEILTIPEADRVFSETA